MAICGNCGAESARIRSRWAEGEQLPDECPSCAPQSFERVKSVRDGQIAMAHEYDHKSYRRGPDGADGLPTFIPTDECLADLEAAATKESEDDKLAYERAVARKRANRRTTPLSAAEIEIIRNKIESQSRESV